MPFSAKQMKELRKAEKRRLRRPQPEIVDLSPLTVKPRERDRFTQRAPMLLLSVEKTLAAASRNDPQLDDSHVAAALVCAIRDTHHDSETISQLLANLELAASESGASPDDWRIALRVIYTSLTNVSSGKSGSHQYLDKAKSFVQQASRV
jgi:hypothetical protein